MSNEEFWKFQEETGFTDDKIKTMDSDDLKKAINKYLKEKNYDSRQL
jgi:hypothetical protein